MAHDIAHPIAEAAAAGDHRPLPGSTPVQDAARFTARATLLSVSCAAVLILLKVAAWRASGSVATLASLADSALDLLASLGAFFAVRYAVAPPDADHRYGHGKAEAFASLIQAGLVCASAALIGQDALQHILHPAPLAHEGWAMAVMAISTLLTAALIAAQTRILKQTHSVAVTGDRAHYAADFGANLVALIGIAISAFTRAPWIDAAAGLMVAAWLVWGAVGVFRESALQLMDHELSAEARGRILTLARSDPRILDIHGLRTRASGPYVHIQMHVALDGSISLEMAHQILVAAERRMLDAFPAADILIHADPEGRAEAHGGAFRETQAVQDAVA